MSSLKWIRRIAAAAMLLAVTACFLDFSGLAARKLGWALHLQFVPAALCFIGLPLAILAITALFGRIYCSVVCPLGIAQDLAVWLRRRFGGKFTASRGGAAAAAREIVRWLFAVAFAAGGFLGLHFAWLEPYAIYGRFMSAAAAPAWRAGNNILAAWAAERGSYLFHAVEVALPPLCIAALATATMALILALALWKGRVWCNVVCPVGTLLGFISRRAPFRVRIDATKCVSCGRCEKVCKARCADARAKRIDASRCVACYSCAAVCGKGAVKCSK